MNMSDRKGRLVKTACVLVLAAVIGVSAWGLACALREQGYVNEGLSAFHSGRYDDAISAFTAAIKENPSNPYAYNDRGLCYFALGDYDSAISDFTKAIELKPDFAEAYYNRGLAYFKKGGYRNREPFKNAISDFTKAIEIKPDFADAYYNRGLAYNQFYNRGRNYDENDPTDYHSMAVADFKKVLEMDPNYALAYAGLGNAYYRHKEYEKADDFFAKALEHEDWIIEKVGEKGLAGVYASRARNLRAMKDYNTSIHYYNIALSYDPELLTALSHQASNYRDIGEYEKAIEFYDKVIALKKDDPTYKYMYSKYQGKGYCYYHLGQYDKALEMYEKAIEECRKNYPQREYRIHAGIGEVYLALGDHDKAMEHFNMTIELASEQGIEDSYVADAHRGLGIAYKELGDKERARQELERAKALYEKLDEKEKVDELNKLLSSL